MMECTDVELVAHARNGDKSAFSSLVERYQSMATCIARRMISQPDAVQDLVQEAMLQAYLSLEYLREDANFRNWFYGIVLNVCRSYIRDQKVNFTSLEAIAGGLHLDVLPFHGRDPDPQSVVEALEVHHSVLAAIDMLSSKNRKATLLFYFEQLSLQEIATLLGISVTAVKSRLHKSRNQLRSHLSESLMLDRATACSEKDRMPPGLNGQYSISQRKRTMVKIEIADVVRDETHKHTIIVLFDKDNQRILPIWVGPFEGEAIVMGLRRVSTHRPLTYHFTASLLETAGIVLEEVRVEALKETTYYAVAKIRNGDNVHEIDARPSDALALAIQTGTPIYVAEEVMAQAGHTLTDMDGGSLSKGKGIDNILAEIRSKQQEASKMAEKIREEEDADESRRRLMALLADLNS